jgi:hypothetical protein
MPDLAPLASSIPSAETIGRAEEDLLSRAREGAGLSDFGEDGFREGLRALLAMYTTTGGLTPQGRKSTRRRLIELLSNRLRIAEAFRQHPEIRARSITRPVYLTGLPRTGTSALFNVLAKDSASRPLLFWEGRHPDPLFNEGAVVRSTADGALDPRFVALSAALERGRQNNPAFAKIHYVRADGPEECVELLAHTLSSVMMGVEPLLAPYDAWFQAQDLRPSYAYYRDLLKLIDWQRPGERWLLKSPCHLWAIDVLVEMFPDACIVQTHRNPVQIIGSYCSMMAALMAGRESFDPAELGNAVLEYLSRSVERAMAAREKADPKRFVDIQYRAFMADPMGTVERVYGAFGLELRGETADAMARHLREEVQNKHGSHDYTLEQFGLSKEKVQKRLAGYVERFDVPVA